ncbi:MAG: histidine phosphatase family protein [Solirubrobacterales bacterium]|jgi:probable phosphoglycerate mutase|nr:histidine phosphatase family protein [Solirubrobacterales bacterium]
MARTGPAVLLVRHSETEWSRSGQHTSRTDLPLLDEGRPMAAALGRRLAGRAFELVLSSPLKRAWETAELTGLGDVAEATDDLLELGYGEYEGRTTADIRTERPGWDIWKDGSPGGESLADAAERVDRVIARAASADGDVALFAHGHILRILGARWLGLPPLAGGSLALSTASLCDLGFERERRVLWGWNDTSHNQDRLS